MPSTRYFRYYPRLIRVAETPESSLGCELWHVRPGYLSSLLTMIALVKTSSGSVFTKSQDVFKVCRVLVSQMAAIQSPQWDAASASLHMGKVWRQPALARAGQIAVFKLCFLLLSALINDLYTFEFRHTQTQTPLRTHTHIKFLLHSFKGGMNRS